MGKKNIKLRIQHAALTGLCAWMTMTTAIQSAAEAYTFATASNAESFQAATGSNAATWSNVSVYQDRAVSTGDFWSQWTGDMSFLKGDRGDGSEEKPYQIATKGHLMGLSELAAMGMIIEEGEGTYPGDYTGAHFELMRDLDLGGMKWNPIGFYLDEAGFYTGEVRPFTGYFHGNGKKISNFRIADASWSHIGLFGVIKDAVIENLTVEPAYILYGEDRAGILCGRAENSRIQNVLVRGTLKTSGTAGGLVGELLEESIVENCTADHIAIDSGEEKEVFAGGIAGKAAGSLILDCAVNTGNSSTARIQGGGYVGGIVGFQNGTDIFQVHVTGTIGGSGSQAIGGVTGKYASGKLKIARFEGTIASSGLGSQAHEGTFIGTHDSAFHFTYGMDETEDLAYLFADSESKIAAGVCGSGIPDDNSFGYDAHIGFWHKNDNFFTLVQGQNTRTETERYFYEELEQGVLNMITGEAFPKEMICKPDHFAPNAVGKPTRGYLLSVLQIDAFTNSQIFYDVAALTAKGSSAYSKNIDRENRSAVAAGDIVTVWTAPKNTDTEKYQMDGVPTYTNENGIREDMEYMTGGSYSFCMPAHDTEVSAVYKRVAANIRVNPEEVMFKVIQERSGNRKNPSIVTEVRNSKGKLITRYRNDQMDPETGILETTVEAIVDTQNDVEDSRVLWSVDDSDLILLKINGDEDNEGYTAMRASIEVNLQSEFFRSIIDQLEKEQEENGYRYAIPDTIYGNGNQGGLAVLTAETRPSSSFEGKSVSANCKIPVTFQIKDHTYVASEGASLDKHTLEFVVTRTLTGNRKTPTETISVTAPQILSATFTPSYFDKKQILWTVSDEDWISVNGENRSASVTAFSDAKWIRDMIEADQVMHQNDWTFIQTGKGKKDTIVTVEAMDKLGHSEYASCQVTVRFETVDQTYLYGGGSGGSSGGSGGSSSKGRSTETADTSVRSLAEDGSVIGIWEQEDSGKWKFRSGDQTFLDAWAYVYNPYAKEGQRKADWFRFDKDGAMQTGWFTDHDGNQYYLWPQGDGTQGHMVTGWHWIQGPDEKARCYYFNTVSDGMKGRLFRNEITPDGYQVNENGVWIVNGTEQIK